jgi:hypothetical protein
MSGFRAPELQGREGVVGIGFTGILGILRVAVMTGVDGAGGGQKMRKGMSL